MAGRDLTVTGALIAGGAGVLLLLGGCGSSGDPGPSTSGPFGHPTKTHWVQCFPVDHRGDVGTFGGLSFHNPGSSAKIENVTLTHARDLQVVAAWIVPITGTDLIGVWNGDPPRQATTIPGVQWDKRQRAAGAVIPHSPGVASENLVLVLKPSGVVGTAKDVFLSYESGGTKYLYDFQVAVIVYNGKERGCLSKSQPKL